MMTGTAATIGAKPLAAPRHRNNFNAIRFLAALMVIYGHMMHIMGEPIFTVYSQAVSSLAVKIFFVISGYLITKSWISDPHFGRYMIRRSFRIFPALIAIVLLSIFVIGPLTTVLSAKEYFAYSSTWMYLKNIALSPVYALPGCFGDYTYPNAINGSFWTLPVEFALYLVLPLLVFVFQKLKILKQGILASAILSAVGALIYLRFFPGARLVVYGSNLPDALPLLPYFFIGSVFSLPDVKPRYNLQLAVALLVLGALINLGSVFTELYLYFALPYFVLSFSLVPEPLFGNWFANCDFSYGLYLFGFPIQQLIWNAIKQYRHPLINLNTVTLLCIAATLLCAIASWYLLEKPFQSISKKLLKKLTSKKEP